MNTSMHDLRHTRRVLLAALLLAALSACDEQASDTARDQSRAPDSTVERKLEVAAETVQETIDDASLTTRVKSALIGEPGLTDAIRIDVDANEGVVTLSGAVESPDVIDRAYTVAAGTEGVREVQNRLTVRATN